VLAGDDQLSVNLDKGLPEGHVITFENEGDQHPDITPGDIKFNIKTEPHPTFKREGDNLYMSVLLTLNEVTTCSLRNLGTKRL
jgi:DnaJ-related protein SCJ1